MMSGGGGDDPFHEPEAHENHERYLLTYADMITLLMALFIILFAIGQTDLEKYKQFADGAHGALSGPSLLTGGGGVVEQVAAASHDSSAGGESDPSEAAEHGESSASTGGVVDERERLAASLARAFSSGGHDEIRAEAAPAGVVVTLPSDEITFASGSWTLLPDGAAALHDIADVLKEVPYEVVVNGHTDDRPMAAPLTNWELSTNRASAVVRELMGTGVPSTRLSAAGYADTRPVAENRTDSGRAANRRVEIVIRIPAAAATGETIDAEAVHGASGGLHIGPPSFDILATAPVTQSTGSSKKASSGH
jgi:chemotaxis protein MotB